VSEYVAHDEVFEVPPERSLVGAHE
jgi:hypothetical protein